MKKYRWVILAALLIALLVAGDIALTRWAPVERSSRFRFSDYETELAQNGGATFERVIFGADELSAVLAATQTDYAVFDLEGGTVKDLASMLKKGYLLPTGELALYLSPAMLLSGEGDAVYPWYRGALEPYLWFERGRIWDYARGLISGSGERYATAADAERYGMLTKMELLKAYPYEGEYSAADFAGGLDALLEVVGWCEANGVGFRVVAAAQNPDCPPPEAMGEAADKALSLCADTLDMRGEFPTKCFYDALRPNREYGASVIGGELAVWLAG